MSDAPGRTPPQNPRTPGQPQGDVASVAAAGLPAARHGGDHLMDADSQGCALVGATPADIVSAKAAGTRSIGYANKAGKREKLTAQGADVVITTMEELASTLLASRCRK